MTENVIEHKSIAKLVENRSSIILDSSETDGIKCVWAGFLTPNNNVNLKCSFDWEDPENQTVESIIGHLIITESHGYFNPHRVEVNLDKNATPITTIIDSGYRSYAIEFEYHLTVRTVAISYDELFAPSDINDVILVVEGMKLHVNKAFLSIHSEFFRALFSANFKEGQLAEIPIEEISCADFGLLMSTLRMFTFPTDRNVEKLLELADRFLMTSITHHIENYLQRFSQLPNFKKLWLADKFGMQKLLNHSIGQINGSEDAKKLKESPENAGLSDRTKAILWDRF